MKYLNVLLTGASGMVGRSALNECLENPSVQEVLCLNRNSLNIQHPKYKEIVLSDFFDLEYYTNQLSSIDTCFFCSGVSSSTVSKEEYFKVTYQITMKVADVLSETNPNITFCYVSGVGTNEKENSRMYWANVKGKVENELLKMPKIKAYMIRLGMLYPTEGIRSKTKSFDRMYRILRPFLFLIKSVFRRRIIRSEDFGKALICLALKGYHKKRLQNKDLYPLAQLPQKNRE